MHAGADLPLPLQQPLPVALAPARHVAPTPTNKLCGCAARDHAAAKRANAPRGALAQIFCRSVHARATGRRQRAVLKRERGAERAEAATPRQRRCTGKRRRRRPHRHCSCVAKRLLGRCCNERAPQVCPDRAQHGSRAEGARHSQRVWAAAAAVCHV
eukprot:308466-Chlamydomonas_euryale.AAC.4